MLPAATSAVSPTPLSSFRLLQSRIASRTSGTSSACCPRMSFRAFPSSNSRFSANEPLVAAQRMLRSQPPETSGAAAELDRFLELSPARAGLGALIDSIRQRLHPGLSRSDVVELQSDLSGLSPTGHIISRTRKSEVIADKAMRVAQRYPVRLGPDERQFYDSVRQLVQGLWGGAGDGWGFQMSLLTAYRITASCIPAAVQYFAERLHGFEGSLADLVEDGDGEEAAPDNGGTADRGEQTFWARMASSPLAAEVRRYQDLTRVDTKFATLRRAIEGAWAEDDESGRPRRKVVLFSFFRRTLEYLERQLRGRGRRTDDPRWHPHSRPRDSYRRVPRSGTTFESS